MKTLLFCFLASRLVGTVLLLGFSTPHLLELPPQDNLKECHQRIKSQVAVIHSPNYPFLYPRFSTCTFVLEQVSSGHCVVQLSLLAFQVGRPPLSQNCSEDFLELQDQHKIMRICGDLPPGSIKFLKFPVDSNQLVFNFKSTFYQKYGFEIEVRQVPDSCSWRTTTTEAPPRVPSPCHESLESRDGHFEFPPPDGSYSSGCTYTVRRWSPRACLLRMDLVHFAVPYSSGCHEHYLKLNDGQRLCGVLGGIQKFLQFSPDSNEFTITSVGSSNHFKIHYMQLPGPCDGGILASANETESPFTNQCDQTLRGSVGSLTSPGHPGSFGPNHRCVFRIFRPDPSVCRLELDFLEFSVGKHNPDSCATGAFLQLPGNHRICHDLSGKMIINVSEFQDPVVLEFQSDSNSSGKGFHIEVIQVSNTCPGFEVHSPIGEIVVPRCLQEVPFLRGHFHPPPMTPTCEWVVRRVHPSACRVLLQVTARSFFSVPCTHNYVQLPDGQRMCVSLAERREIEFPEGSTFMTLDYSSWHFPDFNLNVEQLRDSCKRQSTIQASSSGDWRTLPH